MKNNNKNDGLEFASFNIDGNKENRNTNEGLEYADINRKDEVRKYTREWIENRIAEQDKLENRIPVTEPKKMTDQEFEEYYKNLVKILEK